MTSKRVTIIDLVTKGPTKGLFARMMNPNLASVMPQVIGVWCEELGHEVPMSPIAAMRIWPPVAEETDVLFIGAFTLSAFTAYAISNIYRRRGAVTVLGGPHARCYPEDAASISTMCWASPASGTIAEVLREPAPHRPFGRCSAAGQPPGSAEPRAALEICRADARQGAADQDRADDRQLRLPL